MDSLVGCGVRAGVIYTGRCRGHRCFCAMCTAPGCCGLFVFDVDVGWFQGWVGHQCLLEMLMARGVEECVCFMLM